MTKLGMWDVVSQKCEEDLSSDFENIFEEGNSEYYMKYTVVSNIKSRDRFDHLEDLVNFCNEDAEKRKILEDGFSQYLSLLYLGKGDVNMSTHYLQICRDHFLDKFANIHPLANESRFRMLSTLQQTEEILEMLSLISAGQNASKKLKINDLIGLWKNRFPSKNDDLEIWDDVVNGRIVMFNYFKSHSKTDSLVEKLNNEEGGYFLRIAKVSRSQNNILTSNNWLKRITDLQMSVVDRLKNNIKYIDLSSDCKTVGKIADAVFGNLLKVYYKNFVSSLSRFVGQIHQ